MKKGSSKKKMMAFRFSESTRQQLCEVSACCHATMTAVIESAIADQYRTHFLEALADSADAS